MPAGSGADATVFYGITVDATSLYAAICAWPQVGGALRFVDLILLRRQKETLRSSTPSARIASIPPEIWRQILGDLVSAEVERAGLELPQEASCFHCQNELSEAKGEPRSWEEYHRIIKDCSLRRCTWLELNRGVVGDVSRGILLNTERRTLIQIFFSLYGT